MDFIPCVYRDALRHRFGFLLGLVSTQVTRTLTRSSEPPHTRSPMSRCQIHAYSVAQLEPSIYSTRSQPLKPVALCIQARTLIRYQSQPHSRPWTSEEVRDVWHRLELNKSPRVVLLYNIRWLPSSSNLHLASRIPSILIDTAGNHQLPSHSSLSSYTSDYNSNTRWQRKGSTMDMVLLDIVLLVREETSRYACRWTPSLFLFLR